MNDYDNIKSALTYIDPHERDTWFRMGAAIKDELGENGFELWDDWSRQSNNYKQNDAKAVWKSIKVGRIRIATLFKAARENGYRPEQAYTPPSHEILAQRAKESQARQQAEQERIAQAHAKAQKTAYGIWNNAQAADIYHAYAQSKGLGLNDVVMSTIRQNKYQGKKQLIIPLYADSKLVNVQTIDEEGNKKFLNGGQKQGAYTVIGDFKQHQQGIILAEGFATAASVYQATGKPVIVAFDAGNLKAVSEKLIDIVPKETPVYFAADNDPNQTGYLKAQAAAEVWGKHAQIILPEFTQSQINEFQERYGENKTPTDFNDLHKLAGIDAVRQAFGMAMERETEPEMVQNVGLPENQEPQEIRTAWGDFPPVVSNGKLGELKNEPEYSAAKAGDVEQSALLVEKLLKEETVQEIKNLIGESKPILVPIQSEEASGKNMIPRTTARALAQRLNLSVDTSIYQSNTAKRTDAGIYHRYVSPPEFKGEVQAGQPYLIVDDTLSVGGTIATLKGYIENNGGKVIGSTVMTAHELKVNIAIKPDMLQSLQQKQGLNEYWREEFGYNVDKLTQQEAGHLRKPSLEQIQERVQEARQSLNVSEDKEINHGTAQETQSAETEQRPIHATSKIDGTAGSRVERASSESGRIPQSLLQQVQRAESTALNELTQTTATSDQDVAISISASEQENNMGNKQVFELGQAVKHENPHLTDISLVVGKSPNGYVLLGDEPVRTPYLQETNGNEFEPTQPQAWISSLVYENKNAEQAYEIFQEHTARYPVEYEWISKEHFMKSFGQEPELTQTQPPTEQPQQPEPPTATSDKDVADLLAKPDQESEMSQAKLDKIVLNWTEQNQDENLEFSNLDELQDWFEKSYNNSEYPEYSYVKNNFTFVINENGQIRKKQERVDVSENEFNPKMEHIRDWIAQNKLLPDIDLNQHHLPTATSEQDVAVSSSEHEPVQDKPIHEMPNSIEYDGFAHEIETQSEPQQEQNQPEYQETAKPQANTGLDYDIPEHLKSRMVAVDTQRLRVANYEVGNLLRYTAPDNPKTVLFEDKGKTIQTARDDQQTIQDMLDIAKAKGWDSIKISGNQEFKQKMWLEAESRGIATKGYKPSPEDLAALEKRRAERATNNIAESEKLKQQSAVPEHPNSTVKTIPQEAVKAADTVKAHATQAKQTHAPRASDTAKSQYETKLAALPPDQQNKARFYERQALAAMRYMPAEFHEKTKQAIYENQTDLIHDGKYHAPDPMKSVEMKQEKAQEPTLNPSNSQNDWEMER